MPETNGSLMGFTDKWYQSRTVWLAAGMGALGMLRAAGLDSELADQLQNVLLAGVAIFLRLGVLNDSQKELK